MAKRNDITRGTPDERFTFEAHPRIISGADDGEPEIDDLGTRQGNDGDPDNAEPPDN